MNAHRLRMLWWRVRTTALLMLPSVRTDWQWRFKVEPPLFNARYYADHGLMKDRHVAFETMAGFYNDRTPGGFMSAEQAKSIYLSPAGNAL